MLILVVHRATRLKDLVAQHLIMVVLGVQTPDLSSPVFALGLRIGCNLQHECFALPKPLQTQQEPSQTQPELWGGYRISERGRSR